MRRAPDGSIRCWPPGPFSSSCARPASTSTAVTPTTLSIATLTRPRRASGAAMARANRPISMTSPPTRSQGHATGRLLARSGAATASSARPKRPARRQAFVGRPEADRAREMVRCEDLPESQACAEHAQAACERRSHRHRKTSCGAPTVVGKVIGRVVKGNAAPGHRHACTSRRQAFGTVAPIAGAAGSREIETARHLRCRRTPVYLGSQAIQGPA